MIASEIAERRIVAVGPGWSARIQLACISAAQLLLRPIGGRGLGVVIDRLADVFGVGNWVVVRPFAGRSMRIGLYDAYWLSTVLRGGSYEPEVGFLLDCLLDSSTTFVDCGANVGWWALYASTRIPARERVIAIEASSSVYRLLAENAELNGLPITCVHGAAWEISGSTVSVATDVRRHAWASTEAALHPKLLAAGFKQEAVTTVSVDEVLARTNISPDGPVVLKVDVEGSEARVLAGARRTLSGDAAVIYEDHGRDPACDATRFVLDSLQMLVFRWHAGELQSVRDVAAARAIKVDASSGYNFIACRPGSTAWQRLLSGR